MKIKFKEKPKLILGLAVIFIAASSFMTYYFINSQPEDYVKIPNLKKDNEKVCENCERRMIDGVYVEKGSENPFPYAVTIDNHIEARPSAGLSQANLVFETEVEGSITRYLAVFANNDEIKKIGPVRSARPYFIAWVKEFSALFSHCGGSPAALAKISHDNITDLNEFYNGKYYWRDKNISAPHNVFTSSEKLNNFLESENNIAGNFFPWKFKDDKKVEIAPDPEIKVDFRGDNFKVNWKYDSLENNYIRYLGGEKHIDNGNEIKAKNIIAQYTESEVLDEKLRLEIKTTGSGKAVICLDGECREGIWKKDKESSRTRYYIRDEEVEFNAGATWIEVLNNGQDFEY